VNRYRHPRIYFRRISFSLDFTTCSFGLLPSPSSQLWSLPTLTVCSVSGCLTRMVSVVLDCRWIILPALAPIIGIADPPFSGAIPTDLPVSRIGGDLLAAVLGASPPLAFRPTANGFTRLKVRGPEDLLTKPTTPFDRSGVVSLNRMGGRVLEIFVESAPHPRRWRSSPTTKPAKLRLFYSGADSLSAPYQIN